MPHQIFSPGTLSAAADTAAKMIIPGIEPGGSRAGRKTKPALLIRDVWAEHVELISGAAEGLRRTAVFLKLSQERDLTPGLLLPIANLSWDIRQGDSTARFSQDPTLQNYGQHYAGTTWVPRVVGLRVTMTGITSINWVVHLDYEQIDIPWMDWFLQWDYLDNVIDNERHF